MNPVLRGKSKEELAKLAEDVIVAYCEGQELEQQARHYKTSKRTLERLLLTVAPLSWYNAQLAKWWVRIEDIHDDLSPRAWRERNSIAFHMDRIHGHIERFKQRGS